MILRNACQLVAPSTFAASVRFPGTSARPASSNSAMKGVVFHTSVAMMTKSDDPRSVSHARSVSNHESMKPVPGVNANFHASAATTVIIPYGMRIDARTIPRPKSARCMTTASAIPSTSSIATEITVKSTVVLKSSHHRLDDSTEV